MEKLKKKINFDIATYCNHKCTFCSNTDERTIKEKTSAEVFEKVMDNVLRYIETDEIGLSAKGEVFTNKDFVKILHLCKKKYKIPYIYVSSNGALVSKEKAIEVIEAGLDSIKFSINAVDKESYYKVHQVDDFDLVIKNFKSLLDLKKEHYPGLKIFISSVIDLSKKQLIEKFSKIFGKDFELVDGVSVYSISYTPKFRPPKNRQVKRKCSIPFNELYINYNGTLGLCCKDYFDAINFGSLVEYDFMQLYNSSDFQGIRDMHKKSEFPEGHLCKNCLLYGDNEDV